MSFERNKSMRTRFKPVLGLGVLVTSEHFFSVRAEPGGKTLFIQGEGVVRTGVRARALVRVCPGVRRKGRGGGMRACACACCRRMGAWVGRAGLAAAA